MTRRVRCTLVLHTVALAALVGCTNDPDSAEQSALGALTKLSTQPRTADAHDMTEADLGAIDGPNHHGGGSEHHGGHLPVACCFPDNSCVDLLPHECMSAGGMPQGMGTDCASTDCSMGGSPVACCFSDNTCSDLLPQECMDAGGMPQGMGTLCESVDCSSCGGHGGGGHGGGHGGG